MKGFNIKGISLFIIVCMAVIIGVIIIFLTRNAGEPTNDKDIKETVQTAIKEMEHSSHKHVSGTIKTSERLIEYSVARDENENVKVLLTILENGQVSNTIEYYQTLEKNYVYLPTEKRFLVIKEKLMEDEEFTFFTLAAGLTKEHDIANSEDIYNWEASTEEVALLLNDYFKGLVEGFIGLGLKNESDTDGDNDLIKQLVLSYVKDESVNFELRTSEENLHLTITTSNETGSVVISETISNNSGEFDTRAFEEENSVPLEEYFFIR